MPKSAKVPSSLHPAIEARLPAPVFHDPKHHIKTYHGDCLEILPAIPAETVDLIFADPPYFLSNDGITCHAGRMVSVNKGDWDRSRGPDINHDFNRAWLAACQRVLKPNGTIWVSGTSHVIHSVGFAMQQLGFKLLNDITWVKPNPPPNLSCRYFTHATETVIWAAKSRKSKHTFHYKLMRQLAGGKQMKSVWEIRPPEPWEKRFGKHPTQKPVALLELILLAASNEGDLVVDPFLGSGTTAIACLLRRRFFCGVETDTTFVTLAVCRLMNQFVLVALRIDCVQIDLDPDPGFVDRSERGQVQEPNLEDRGSGTVLVHRERKFFFVGLHRREVIYSVAAKSRIPDAAYSKMIQAIQEDETPNIFALHYDRDEWRVRNLILIPRFAYSQKDILRRAPLSPAAQRHDWVGCDISLRAIPQRARISVILDGIPISPVAVRQEFERLKPLQNVRTKVRGWTLDVLLIVESLGKPEFDLPEVYAHEEKLRKLHLRNRHVQPKIRQQLQKLRDLELLTFLGGGRYRLR